MAKNSFSNFVNEVLSPSVSESHKVQALQVAFDIILVYGGDPLHDVARHVRTF